MNTQQSEARTRAAAEEEIFKRVEAANYLTLAPRTLDEYAAAKAIPVIRRGRFVRFLKSDLDEFIARHRVAAKPAPAYRTRRRRSAAD